MEEIGRRINRKVCWGGENNPIPEAKRALWYARIDAIRRGDTVNRIYAHHPLEEPHVLLRRMP